MSNIIITVRKTGYLRSLIVPLTMALLLILDEGEGWVKLSISDKNFWNKHLKTDLLVDFDFKFNDLNNKQSCISVLYAKYKGDGVFLKTGTKIALRLYYDSRLHDNAPKLF